MADETRYIVAVLHGWEYQKRNDHSERRLQRGAALNFQGVSYVDKADADEHRDRIIAAEGKGLDVRTITLIIPEGTNL